MLRGTLLLALLASCETLFPLHAPADPGTDGSTACATDDQCTDPLLPACDLETETCVACTPDRAEACTGTTPVCGAGNTCQPCKLHGECTPSNACLPDGTCAAVDQVAYVSPTGSGMLCTLTAPCSAWSDALAANRPIIKAAAGTYDEQVDIVNRDVTVIVDPGAELLSSAGGVLQIRGTSTVAIHGLMIRNSTGGNPNIFLPSGGNVALTLGGVRVERSTGAGIKFEGGTVRVVESVIDGNAAPGIFAPSGGSGGTLELSRSTISRNGSGANGLGGVHLTGVGFVIVGNVFFANGGPSSLTGGVFFSSLVNAADRLEFNSFLNNDNQSNSGTAINCSTTALVARHNIMQTDQSTGTQATGDCTHELTIAFPALGPAGAMVVDPKFKDPIGGDLHIMDGSPAIMGAAMDADLSGPAQLDIDGDPRVAPATIGADQVP